MGEPTEEEAVARLERFAASLRPKAPTALAIRTVLTSLAKHKEALEPFAAIARRRHPEDPKSPSRIDLITQRGRHDELRLSSHVEATGFYEVLDAADFRRASNPGGA